MALSSGQIYVALVAIVAGIPQNAAVADEPEPIKSAVYAGINDSLKTCLKKVSRDYSQDWAAARTGGPVRFDKPLPLKPIDEASKTDILIRFKRGLNYCKKIHRFALEHAKIQFGEPENPAALQTLITKEPDEMLKADVKEMTDALLHALLAPDEPGRTNFINMIGVLKELDRYRRQVIAEVFTPP